MQTGRCCGKVEAMSLLFGRKHGASTWQLLAIFLVFLTQADFAEGDETGPGSAIQPAIALVFRTDLSTVTEEESKSMSLVFSATEAAFRDQRRYALERLTGWEDAAVIDHVAVDLSIVRRPDGSLGANLDIWDGTAYTTSRVFDLPLTNRRFAVAAEVARVATESVAALFPGFGRLGFDNAGADVPYHVYANGVSLGGNVEEIALPVGSYDIEIRRRDDGFEHIVGRSSIRLENDDFKEVQFSLPPDPPPVPGYLRLIDPNERWTAILDIRGAYMIPIQGFDEIRDPMGVGSFATATFNDVPLRGLLFGFEAGHVLLQASGTFGDRVVDLEMTATPLMATIGWGVGPVDRFDFVLRGSGGVTLTSKEITAEEEPVDPAIPLEPLPPRADGLAAAVGGVMEFGVVPRRTLRFSLQASWFGVVEEDTVFSWIGVGLGVGGRF
jgi:hypothetical protein